MRYSASVTIPANTTESDPHEEYLDVCFGTISQVFVLFPPGHAGLTHLQVFYQTRQIFPSTPGESFTGDDTQHVFEERQPILEVPHRLLLRAWNSDTTYEHTIYVGISVLAPEILMPVVIQSPALPEGME
jgi:hypothetical protein